MKGIYKLIASAKKIILATSLLLVLNNCEKKTCPIPDRQGGYGANVYYTNKYILKEINANIITEQDTVKYNDMFIQLNLSGDLVSENTFYTENNNENSSNPYISEPIEQKYFINVLKEINVSTNVIYNSNNNNQKKISNILVQFRNKEGYYFEQTKYNEIGYTPIKLYLSEAPDTAKHISFKIELIDNYNNKYITSTNEIFIDK